MESSMNFPDPEKNYEMANDPAFLFYPGDYLRDTQCLSEACQVAYDRIMCEHMRNMSEDMNNICVTQQKLNFFTKRLSLDEKDELLAILTSIGDSFQIKWVAESIYKRVSYGNSRRENRQGKGKNTSLSYDPHMENENENEDEDEKKSKKKKPATPPHHFHESIYFDSGVLSEALMGTKYETADIEFYHSAADNWSRSKTANKKSDWLATVKNFMLRDMGDGKFKTKKTLINGTHQQPVGGNGQKQGTSEARTETAKKW